MVSDESQESEPPEPALRFARRILVGIGDRRSPATLQAAAAIGQAADSSIELLHVGSDGDVLADAFDTLEQVGMEPARISVERREGSAPAELNRRAIETDTDLVIVERGGQKVAHVPHQIAYHAPCDILLVSADRPGRTDRYRRILIATDGSATADRAARRGFALARGLGAAVVLLFVGHPKTGEMIVADTIHSFGDGVETEPRLMESDPATSILKAAEASDTDLVVVGNKGLTQARMFLGGSVPGAVLKGARRDLLLCRTVRQLESELEPGEGGVIVRDGEPMAAYLDEDGVLHLMSARCTHLGCTVAWDPGDRTFQCPCHGSAFSPTGEVLSGPANRRLRSVDD